MPKFLGKSKKSQKSKKSRKSRLSKKTHSKSRKVKRKNMRGGENIKKRCQDYNKNNSSEACPERDEYDTLCHVINNKCVQKN